MYGILRAEPSMVAKSNSTLLPSSPWRSRTLITTDRELSLVKYMFCSNPITTSKIATKEKSDNHVISGTWDHLLSVKRQSSFQRLP